MVITVITLFPEFFRPLLKHTSVAKAQKEQKLKIKLLNLRDFGSGKHKQVDDRPYGGGIGMLLKVDVIAKAIERATTGSKGAKVILLTPQGKIFKQKTAQRLSKTDQVIIVCGHYEGVDERVRKLVDEELSIGDYVLSSGEIGAMVVIESVARLLPGVLESEATKRESFSQHLVNHRRSLLLEPPQYTRPKEFKGIKVPKILLSGDHQKIKEWRLKEAIKKTKKRRPDLIKEGD